MKQTARHLKRSLCLLAAVMILTTLFAAFSVTFAATYSGACGTNMNWSLNTSTGVLSITGSGSMTNYTYILSSGGSSAPWYNYRSYIKSVTIGNRVTSIGEYAFSGCSKLKSVTIPDSVTSIGSSAFSGTAWYNNQPNGLVYAGKVAYKYKGTCPSSVTIKDGTLGIADSAFSGCTGLTSVTIPKSVTSIGISAFSGCTGLTSVTIPDSVKSIGENAFHGCSFLEEITLPFTGDKRHKASDNYQYPLGYIFGTSSYAGGTATTQGYYGSSMSSTTSATYYIPSSLTKVTITDCEYIPYGAFYNCSRLTSITIPDNVTSIGSEAFYGCNSLTDIIVNVGNLEYSSENGVLYNKSITVLFVYPASKKDNSFSIPDGVTSIGEYAFYKCTGLTSVTIPDSVTNIGAYAFRGCACLTSVTIPDSVTSIGNNAFQGCKGLTSVTIGNGVTSIGNYAFDGCIGLTSVTIGNGVTSIEYSAFRGCTGLTSVTIPNSVTSIGNDAFQGCKGLTSVTIPDSVTSIGNNAFQGCIGLTSVTIGNGVTSIGNYAFDGCIGLTSVTIGNGVTSIEYSAFRGCTGLTSVTIPNSVTSIGNNAFQGCKGLTSVTIGNGVTSIRTDAFSSCTGLTGVYITDLAAWCGISFGNSSSANPLSNAHNLYVNNELVTSLVIPNGVTSIGSDAFRGCTGLISVTIPDSVTSIGIWAFCNCTELTSVTIGNGVTSIGNNAFQGCKGLTSVTIGNCVTSIGSNAFSDTAWYNDQPDGLVYAGKVAYKYKGTCSSSVVIQDGTLGIADYSFYDCAGLTSVTIPDSVTSIGSGAFSGCTGLSGVYITDLAAWCGISFGNSYANPLYHAHNLYVNNEPITSLVIPSGVTSIGEYAFYGCTGLTSVTIPNSVTSIGEWAFSMCTGLTSVTIPDSVTGIGSYAFDYTAWYKNQPDGLVYAGKIAYKYKGTCPSSVTIKDGTLGIAGTAFSGCTGLTSVTIPNSVTNIGGYAFYNCTGLTSIKIPDRVTSIGDRAFYGCIGLTSVTIGNGVTSIEYSAFRGCTGLTSIKIPDRVTSIGDYAFYGCSNLQTVDYRGSQAEWGSVTIGTENNSLTSASISFHGHVWDEGVVTKKATCTEDGIKTSTCATCGENKVVEIIPATGHSWATEYTVDKAPTVKAEGVKSIHCTVCNTVKPGSEVKIPKIETPTPAIDPAKEFSDISKKAWYYTAVDYAVNNGLFAGANGKFDPDGDMTRGMFVSVLARMAGVTVNNNVATKFSDVKKGQWFAGAVKWASDNGIVTGSYGRFMPNDPITREQICSILVTYSKFMKITLKANTKAVTFKDAKKISSWARSAVATCQKAGLIAGTNGNFDPKGKATRAAVAQILMKFDQNFGNK